jgi:peptide-methionine (S)-S-oxide reductase
MAIYETATLGGGCFWCLEAVYLEMEGVTLVQSGYMGGLKANPSYKDVCTGKTGHAEVVQVTFDPAVVTFRDILEVFFAIHDPTTKDRQGNDVGSQYRSAIFYHNEEQHACAEQVCSELNASKVFPGKIVTEISPATEFYPAEDYHSRYFENHPEQSYCVFIVSPKVKKFREKFAQRRKIGA